jgi:hypothetical protein
MFTQSRGFGSCIGKGSFFGQDTLIARCISFNDRNLRSFVFISKAILFYVSISETTPTPNLILTLTNVMAHRQTSATVPKSIGNVINNLF